MKKTILLIFIISFINIANARFMWTPEQLMQYQSINSVQISPDGEYAAFAATKNIKQDNNWQSQTQIYITNTKTLKTSQLTNNDKQSNDPKWSPNGKWLAFTAKNEQGIRNIYIMAKNGSTYSITNSDINISQFKWSQNSKMIAYTKIDKINEPKTPQPIIVGEKYPTNNLWIIKLDNDARPISDAQSLLTHGKRQFDIIESFNWAPDNNHIVFEHHIGNRDDVWNLGKISIVDLATKKVIPLIESQRALHQPFYSPDGKYVAIIASQPNPTWNMRNRIFIIATKDKKIKKLAWSPNQQPAYIIGWSTNSKQIYFLENYHTYTKIYALPITGAKPIAKTYKGQYINIATLSPNNKYFGVVMQKSIQPNEVYFSNPASKPFYLHQLTQLNIHFPTKNLPLTKIITWRAKDGLKIEGLLTYPGNYQAGEKYPLLVEVHGGPDDVFYNRFLGRPSTYPIPVFASKGYFYLRPNIRGSNGYGNKFRIANFKDWGGKDFQDILAGINSLLNKGKINKKHIGILGWSYGGYMVAWSITQTKLFSAAVFGGGITDLISYSNTCDLQNFIPAFFGGNFWQVPKLYLQRSPISHVQHATTPTLILHGAKDFRVPVSQALEFYHALKKLKVPTKMIIYPNTYHGIRNLNYTLMANHEIIKWFEKYL